MTATLGQPAASVDTVDGRGYGDIHPGCPSVAGAGQQYVSEMASSNMGDFDHWETSISEAFVALRASTPDPASFRGALVQVGHGELCHLTTVDAAPQDVARSPGLVRRNPTDSVMIGLQTRGRGFVEQDGRVAAVGPGDLVVYDPARPYTLRFPTPFVTRVLLLPRTHLREVEQAIGDLTARALPGAGGIGAVFGAFVTSVAEQRDTLTEDTHQSLCWQAAALGTALLRTVAGTSTPHSPAQEDLLRRARTYAEEHLADPALNAAALARALHVSPRYLFKLFAERETTPGRWIQARRLDRARAEIAANPAVLVSVVAARCGFADPTHFSRAFKSRFGLTPSAFAARVAGR